MKFNTFIYSRFCCCTRFRYQFYILFFYFFFFFTCFYPFCNLRSNALLVSMHWNLYPVSRKFLLLLFELSDWSREREREGESLLSARVSDIISQYGRWIISFQNLVEGERAWWTLEWDISFHNMVEREGSVVSARVSQYNFTINNCRCEDLNHWSPDFHSAALTTRLSARKPTVQSLFVLCSWTNLSRFHPTFGPNRFERLR